MTGTLSRYLLAAMVLTAVFSGPAMAEEHWHGGDGDHWHRGFWPGHYGGVVIGPRVYVQPPVAYVSPPPVVYAPPPVMYAPPPPVYYAPPPVVVPAPGLSVGINIPLH